MQCNAIFPNYRLPKLLRIRKCKELSRHQPRSSAVQRLRVKMFNCSSDNDSDSASDSLTSLTSLPGPAAPVPEDVLWFLNNVFSASRRTDQLPLLRTRGGMEQNILR